MKAPTKILLYFVSVLLFGALLSPPLFWAVRRLAVGAEARGWLRYENKEETPRAKEAWEMTGWVAQPIRFVAGMWRPWAEAQAVLFLDKTESPEAKAERKAREQKAPPLAKVYRKFFSKAEARGWFFKPSGAVKDSTPEREAKGWCAFLDADFSKVSNRAIIIAAIALLFPLLRSLRIKTLAQIGLQKNPFRWSDFAVAWAVALGVMLLLGGILLSLGVYKMQDDPPWGDLGQIFVSGIVVALLEEWVFRGAILGTFRQSMSDYRALFCVSALFSILHFLKPPETVLAPEQVTWLSGFSILPERFSQFEQPLLLLGGFATLFLFGWVAGWAAIHTRGLAMGIGFHAGMVLGKMGFNRVTRRPKDMRELLPWIGEDITVGIVGILVITLVGVLLFWYVKKMRRKTA